MSMIDVALIPYATLVVKTSPTQDEWEKVETNIEWGVDVETMDHEGLIEMSSFEEGDHVILNEDSRHLESSLRNNGVVIHFVEDLAYIN